MQRGRPQLERKLIDYSIGRHLNVISQSTYPIRREWGTAAHQFVNLFCIACFCCLEKCLSEICDDGLRFLHPNGAVHLE